MEYLDPLWSGYLDSFGFGTSQDTSCHSRLQVHDAESCSTFHGWATVSGTSLTRHKACHRPANNPLYVYIYIYIYLCANTHLHVWLYNLYIHIHIYIHTCVCTCIIYLHTHICSNFYINEQIKGKKVYTQVYVHIYICTHTFIP